MSRSMLVKLREVRRRDGRIARIALALTEVLYTGALSVLKSENGPEMTVPPLPAATIVHVEYVSNLTPTAGMTVSQLPR